MKLIAIGFQLTRFVGVVQVLKVFTFPVTITTFQFLVGTVIVLLMWTTGLHKRPKVTQSQVRLFYCSDSRLPFIMIYFPSP